MTRRRIALTLAAILSAGTLAAQTQSGDQSTPQPGTQGPSEHTELHPLSDQDRSRLQNQNPPPQAPAKTPDQSGGGSGHSGGETPYKRGLINIRTAHNYGEATIVVHCDGQRWRLTVPPSAWCCPPSDDACIDQMDEDGENKYFPPLNSCPFGSIYNRAYRKCETIKEVSKIEGCVSPCLAKWLLNKDNAGALVAGPSKEKP